jgi:hypothetical protein
MTQFTAPEETHEMMPSRSHREKQIKHLHERCTILAIEVEILRGLIDFYNTVVGEAERLGEMVVAAADLQKPIGSVVERVDAAVAGLEILRKEFGKLGF